jgi:predicted phage terminase large subunit-like protein
VFGVDQKHGKVYVFDAYHTRLPAPEQERQVVADYRHFKPDAVVIEAIAAQDSLPQYLNKKHPAMRVVRHKPTVDKVNRMNSITHLLFNGSILFSEDLRPDKMAFPERGDLISELFDFPIGTNDDMCDAFSQGLRFIGNRYLMTAGRDSGGEVHAIGLGGKFEG